MQLRAFIPFFLAYLAAVQAAPIEIALSVGLSPRSPAPQGPPGPPGPPDGPPLRRELPIVNQDTDAVVDADSIAFDLIDSIGGPTRPRNTRRDLPKPDVETLKGMAERPQASTSSPDNGDVAGFKSLDVPIDVAPRQPQP